MRKNYLLAAAVLAATAAPVQMLAQTAVVSGSLSGFDVLNRTGQSAHGFEIQLEGAIPSDLYYTVYGGRYGNPAVIPYATGVKVRYSANYSGGVWTATTPVANYAAFSWNNCYLGGAGYSNSGCEHLGQSMRPLRPGASLTVTGRWLVEDSANPGQLVSVDPPAALPATSWVVVAPTTTLPSPPQVAATVVAPVPPPPPAQFSDAHWVKIFKTELPRKVEGAELTSDNPSVVPEDVTQIETDWDILQKAPPGVQNRRGRGVRINSAGLSITSESVIRRYEIYKFSGAYDALTHEVTCADGNLCNAPSAGELGEPVSANNTAANVVADSLTLNKTGSGASSANVVIGGTTCNSASCANFSTNGAVITLTASPSGTVFGGWSGACTGTQLTCNATINGKTGVTADFKKIFTLSGSAKNSGTVSATPNGIDRALNCGKDCSAKFADGTSVTITATPPTGKAFVGWVKGCSGNNPVCVLTVKADISVQAEFGK